MKHKKVIQVFTALVLCIGITQAEIKSLVDAHIQAHGNQLGDLADTVGGSTLVGHDADDCLIGGPGNDNLVRGAGTDTIDCGDGVDSCTGGEVVTNCPQEVS